MTISSVTMTGRAMSDHAVGPHTNLRSDQAPAGENIPGGRPTPIMKVAGIARLEFEKPAKLVPSQSLTVAGQ
jgi:hypothetical protein